MYALLRSTFVILLVAPTLSNAEIRQCPEDDKTLIIGVREDAPPFAWRVQHDERNKSRNSSPRFQGYSVELCELIARRALQDTRFQKRCMVPVTAKNRFQKLAKGDIHLLCGASTVTIARMEEVDFSLFTFLSGASILYSAQKASDDRADDALLKIGVLEGTTTENEVRRIGGDFHQLANGGPTGSVDIRRIPYDTHNDAVDGIIDREINAYLADREILLALQQRIRKKLREQADSGQKSPGAADTEKAGKPDQTRKSLPLRPTDIVVSEHYFTFEPYAIGIAKDERKLRIVANKVLSELFNWQSSGFMGQNIATILARHFPRKTFSNALETLFRVQRIPLGTPIDMQDPD